VLHTALPLPPELQLNSTASTLAVPKQGSPKVVVLGKTVQLGCPRQAACTTELLLAAEQEPAAKEPQLAVEGVP
jgi:hypothetical protein